MTFAIKITADRFWHNLPKDSLLVVGSMIWETSAYFGLRVFLVLFLTKYIGYSDGQSFGLYLAMVAMADVFGVLGGGLGDSKIGNEKVAIFGSILLCIGFISMSIPIAPLDQQTSSLIGHTLFPLCSDITLHIGAACLSTGVAFYRPNCFMLVGRHLTTHAKKSPNNSIITGAKVDSGTALLYSLIDIGFIVAYIAVGPIAEGYGWYSALTATSVFMLLSCMLLCVYQMRSIGGFIRFIGWFFDRRLLRLLLIALPLIAFCYMCINDGIAIGGRTTIMSTVSAGAICTLIYGAFVISKMQPRERVKIYAFMTYLLFLLLFIAIERQIYTIFPLFFMRNTTREIFGATLPVSALYIIMPFCMLAMGPINAYFLHKWKGKSPLPGIRCALGFALFALCYLFMVISCKAANANGITMIWYPLIAITCFAAADTMFIPAMLSMATRFAPPKMEGVFNGIVFVWIAMGTMFAKVFAASMEMEDNKHVDSAKSILIYGAGFEKLMWISVALTAASVIAKAILDKSLDRNVIHDS